MKNHPPSPERSIHSQHSQKGGRQDRMEKQKYYTIRIRQQTTTTTPNSYRERFGKKKHIIGQRKVGRKNLRNSFKLIHFQTAEVLASCRALAFNIHIGNINQLLFASKGIQNGTGLTRSKQTNGKRIIIYNINKITVREHAHEKHCGLAQQQAHL